MNSTGSPTANRRPVASVDVAGAMLRAALLPAGIVGLGCLVFGWIADGPAAALTVLGGVLLVVAVLAVGPAVFALTRGSSPGVTFVAGVFGFFGLVGVLGLVLVALIEADWLPVGYLALALIASFVAGFGGMFAWTLRARMPVYEPADPPA